MTTLTDMDINLGSDEDANDSWPEDTVDVSLTPSEQFGQQDEAIRRIKALAGRPVKGGTTRPKMDLRKQSMILSKLLKGTKNLWPERPIVLGNEAGSDHPRIKPFMAESDEAGALDENDGSAPQKAMPIPGNGNVALDKWQRIKRKMDAVSAPTFSHEVACEKLSMDPRNSIISKTGTRLRFWQTTAISTAIRMEQSSLQGVVIADEGGLGKTVTALGLVLRAPDCQIRRDSEDTSLEPLEPVEYRPTLIVTRAGDFDG